MGRRGRIRLVAVVAALCIVPLMAGCVVLRTVGLGPQQDVIGDFPVTITACASGSAGCDQNGLSGVPALTGTGQILLAVLADENTSIPSSLVSTGPEALAFAPSPSYAAELQRLDPAPPGKRWLGFISQAVDFQAGTGPQAFTVNFLMRLRRGADGAPFSGRLGGSGGQGLATITAVGVRAVSPAGPASRPVACGPSLYKLHDEVPPPSTGDDVWVICADSTSDSNEVARDLGVLDGAVATGQAGGVETLPFLVRYAGPATPAADFRLSASTQLPGATAAVTPATLVPASNSPNLVSVAVGIPAGARPGKYEVTLTARLANGQVRSGTGTLTVLPGPAGGPAARLRVTTILPRRLSAKIARRRGIVVLIGATKGGFARVQLFQGKGKRPKAAKRVRLKVPGPTRVVLKSAKLRKGPYRIVIRADARTFVRRAVLAK